MRNPDLIGTTETCEILGGIDRSTLVRRVARGELRAASKLPGVTGPWMFDRAEVLRHKAEVDALEAARAALGRTAS
jgi:hypothetical protein